jgi:hypothetical protein
MMYHPLYTGGSGNAQGTGGASSYNSSGNTQARPSGGAASTTSAGSQGRLSSTFDEFQY